jgi:glucose/arabinose dehydrogenase
MTRPTVLVALTVVLLAMAGDRWDLARAQDQEAEPFISTGLPAVPLPNPPVTYETAERQDIRVSVVTAGLTYPWGMTFLPDGRILVTERGGTLRTIRDGVLNPAPVSGVPQVHAEGLSGLMDVAVHPRFEENQWVYLTYSKPTPEGPRPALARGRLDRHALVDVDEIFVSNDVTSIGAAARLVFAQDGALFMSVGGAFADRRPLAQDPAHHTGKILRLRDDGTAPDDNPFIDQPGHAPEVFSLGHRNQMGVAIHPDTGELWASEHGPMGGDEVNRILPGGNYGWPVVSHGREYGGALVSDQIRREDLVSPDVVWIPSIGPAGMTFYAGDRFPAWRGDLFVGALRVGRVDRTGHLQRIGFNRAGQEQRRESLLADLRRRIRDVVESPDGLLYVLTAGNREDPEPTRGAAAILKIEPVE